MPFAEVLNEQVGHEFAASQQYVAIAVHYDAQTLPRLAAHFYRQAVEERNHALMIVQYLLDADERVAIPGLEAPQTAFGDVVEPVRLALEQEKRVTEQIKELAQLARAEGELVGEQFLHWFLQEQREEVSSMGALLTVVERSRDNVMLIEDYLAREAVGDGGVDAGRHVLDRHEDVQLEVGRGDLLLTGPGVEARLEEVALRRAQLLEDVRRHMVVRHHEAVRRDERPGAAVVESHRSELHVFEPRIGDLDAISLLDLGPRDVVKGPHALVRTYLRKRACGKQSDQCGRRNPFQKHSIPRTKSRHE